MLDDDGSMERGEGMNPMVCDDRIKRAALSGGGVYGGGGDGIDAIFGHKTCTKGDTLATMEIVICVLQKMLLTFHSGCFSGNPLSWREHYMRSSNNVGLTPLLRVIRPRSHCRVAVCRVSTSKGREHGTERRAQR